MFSYDGGKSTSANGCLRKSALPKQEGAIKTLCLDLMTYRGEILELKLVPDVGIELTTFALQVRCSTN